jgi:hypothetical protein
MENELEMDTTETPNKPTSLLLVITLSLMSYIAAFCSTLYEYTGVFFSTALFDHPEVFGSYLAQAFGGSLIFPILHVGIASFFKSKRNPSSRRNIFTGWAIAITIIQILMII